MAKKLRDLAVKTGTYTNQQGEEKGQWQNVGALMKGDDGNEFIILKRWFNPAGLPNPDNRDSVIVSCFKDDKGGQSQPPQQPQPQRQPQGNTQQPGVGNQFDDFDDDVGF